MENLISQLKEQYGTELNADTVRSAANSLGMSYATLSKKLKDHKVGRGKWNLEVTQEKVEELEKEYAAPSVEGVATTEFVKQNLIPQKDDTFVSFGNFSDIKKIIQSRLFYPAFITGLSGNGKTFGVEQACAQLGRELIRVNITIETDEDDLVGGFRLASKGNSSETVFHKGPVIEALERGAILLLDECLEENEEVMVGTVDNYSSVKLSDLEYNTEYPVVSFNMQTGELENDTGSIISDKEDEIYEVELENGKTIKLNAKHPFIVEDSNGKYVERTIESGLKVGDSVISFD